MQEMFTNYILFNIAFFGMIVLFHKFLEYLTWCAIEKFTKKDEDDFED